LNAPVLIGGYRIPPTRAAAKPVTCRRGDSGPLVRKLQRLLYERGHSELNTDGVFGPATLDAVLKYQRGAGLAADGLVGHRTLASLQNSTPTGRPMAPAAPAARSLARPMDDVHQWPAEKIVFEVFKRAGTKLPSTMLAQWNAFATKDNAKWMLGIVAVGAIVQFIPGAGEIFDGAMVGLFLVTAGPAAFEGGQELGRFLLAITGAATEPDIDTAAEHLARAVTLLGVTAVLTWLQRRAVRGAGARGAPETAESPRSTPETPPEPKARLPSKPADTPESTRPVASEINQAREANWKRPDGRTWWPPNDGAAGPSTEVVLREGTPIDRFGGESGTYLSPSGTPFEQRSLPSVPDGAARNYVVAKPLAVQQAEVAPWFDQPGGGTQYKLVPPDGWNPDVDGTFDVSAAKRLGYLVDGP
jgi:peptidoglycan hydrolase-like protein with peptidoglycan-binding domain